MAKLSSTELFNLFLLSFEIKPNPTAGPNTPRYSPRCNLFKDPKQIENVLNSAGINVPAFSEIPAKADNKSRLGMVIYFLFKLCKELSVRQGGPSAEFNVNSSAVRIIHEIG